ncbi:MAG: glycosyltransferase [Pirellulales bacterium]
MADRATLDITVVLTTYRRPQVLSPQVEAIRAQTVAPKEIWVWANQPTRKQQSHFRRLKLDRVVASSANARVHARFALALTARTQYVALFDDDTLPGPAWFENCLATMECTPGILGAAGVRIFGSGYANRTVHGWHDPSPDTVEVDLVGHAWFLRTEWLRFLFDAPAVTGTNGEDIELSARALRLGGIHTYCPPHPPGDRRLWGSTKGVELGSDAVAASRLPKHLEERDLIVRAEIEAGWQPLWQRANNNAPSTAAAGTALAIAPEATSLADIQPVAQSAAAEVVVTEPTNIWQLVPAGVKRILHVVPQVLGEIGDDAAGGNSHLPTAVQAAEVVRVTVHDIETAPAGFAEGPFHCIVCDDVLTEVVEPQAFLHALHARLSPEGCLVADVPNVRHHRILQGLLAGRWPAGALGPLRPRDKRLYTRREIEKCLYRAGLRVDFLRPATESAHAGAFEPQRINTVRAGRLHVGGLSAAEAAEFYAERFFVRATPVERPEYPLTSIVIVTHNQLDYTHQCLESIRFRTDQPYELILVDNGSTDGTVEYLRECDDVRLIINDTNRGFPAAANQGIQASSGSRILLLNNDVLVTTGWLDRLLAALDGDHSIGLAGPCSNNVSGSQRVDASYGDLASLDGFAWDWGHEHDRRVEEVDRLVGFCLLVRRELVDAIGLLDERFGIGNFEDDDFCLRARQAGFKAVIARDAFVHHFGHATFQGSGIDLNGLLERNERLFREKWSSPPAANGRNGPPLDVQTRQVHPGPPPMPETVPPRFTARLAETGGLRLVQGEPLVSLCMIVRNNEPTIGPCLESIRPWVDEMIVVDTGSLDQTPAICQRLGARVFHFPWCDDFSAARNESLRHAQGKWIFWMDSDDVIDSENGRKLRALILEADGSEKPLPETLLAFTVAVHCPAAGADGFAGATVVDHVKLLRNRPDLRFVNRIHEQIVPAVRRAGGDIQFTDIYVIHAGADRTPEGERRKIERDLRLLKLELADKPADSFALFNLGMTYADARRYEEAISTLQACLAAADPDESHVRKVYALLVSSHYQLGRFDAAWEICQAGRRLFPKDPELLFREGLVAHHFGRLDQAEQAYLAALANDDDVHFSSMDRGIVGYKARHNLAAVYSDMGAVDKAEQQWRLALAEVPAYADGWRGLGETLFLQDKLPEARQVLEQIAAQDPADAASLHNLGTVYLRTRQYERAIDAYRASLDARPDSPDTHVHLGYALKESGRLAEAVDAWMKALELDPGNADARRELGGCGLIEAVAFR